MDDSQATDLFLTLTPDKVLEAVEAAGLRCSPVCYPLNSFENRVYEVELDDGRRVVGRRIGVYFPRDLGEGGCLSLFAGN